MENILEIKSTNTSVQAQKIINGDTADFFWNSPTGTLPSAVNFALSRGKVADEIFTGNHVVTGAFYPGTNKLDIQNNNFIDTDLEIYAALIETCKEIALVQSKAE